MGELWGVLGEDLGDRIIRARHCTSQTGSIITTCCKQHCSQTSYSQKTYFAPLGELWDVCYKYSLQWRHNECDGVSNCRCHDCLLNRLFRRRSKKTSKLRVTGLCEGNLPMTSEFPAQRASDAKMFPFDDIIMPGRIVHFIRAPHCIMCSRLEIQSLSDSNLMLWKCFYWWYLVCTSQPATEFNPLTYLSPSHYLD